MEKAMEGGGSGKMEGETTRMMEDGKRGSRVNRDVFNGFTEKMKEDGEKDIGREEREGDNPTFPPHGEVGQREKKKQEAKKPPATIPFSHPPPLPPFFPLCVQWKPSFALIYIHTSYGASHRATAAQYYSKHTHIHTLLQSGSSL